MTRTTSLSQIAISVMVPLLLLTACDSKKSASPDKVAPTPTIVAQPTVPPKPTEAAPKSAPQTDFTVNPPTTESMQRLGVMAGKGDLTAIDTLSQAHDFLYKDIDYKDRKRLLANLKLMNAAFFEIGNAVAQPDKNDPAFQSLVYAIKTPSLRSVTADALGVAAAKGHQPSLYILLHASNHKLMESAVIGGISTAAKAGNEDALNHLLNIMSDQGSRSFWYLASKGITPAAEKGNERAKAALARFEESRKDDFNPRKASPTSKP